MLKAPEIIQRVEELIAERGTSMGAIAKKFDLNEGALRNARAQGTYLGLKSLREFSRALRVPVSYLIGEEGEPGRLPPIADDQDPMNIVRMRAVAHPDEIVGLELDVDTGTLRFLMDSQQASYLQALVGEAARQAISASVPSSSKA